MPVITLPMLKLLLCLVGAFAIAAVLLHLRHEKMEINYRINQAHRRLQTLQTELWNQQLQMAIATSPAAVQKTVGEHRLNLIPASPIARTDAAE
ncbi:MAG: hypothetical protein JWM57_1763 [Phycisphaerales bacterium]|nr:hypothetical protein [Phycisphaerales bacterium]